MGRVSVKFNADQPIVIIDSPVLRAVCREQRTCALKSAASFIRKDKVADVFPVSCGDPLCDLDPSVALVAAASRVSEPSVDVEWILIEPLSLFVKEESPKGFRQTLVEGIEMSSEPVWVVDDVSTQ